MGDRDPISPAASPADSYTARPHDQPPRHDDSRETSTEPEAISSVGLTRSDLDARVARVTRVLFWVAAASFLAWYGWVASFNEQPNGWDSAANLIVARNIAEGRGFVKDYVGDYVVRHELPGPEVTRPPGLPYLIAPIFYVFGASSSAHIWLNVVIVLLSAWLVRTAIRVDGGDWPADVAGLAMLQVHALPTAAWNNGPLILLTAAMLLLVVLSLHRRITGTRLALACAVVVAIGFLMKQTFVVGGGACSMVLLGTASQRSWRQRLGDCVVFGGVFLLLTSPYWATNLARYGEMLYAPVHQFHLQHHYGVNPWYDYYRRVLWDEQPLSLAEVVRQVGVSSMIRGELQFMRERATAIAVPNPFLLVPAAIGVLLMRRGQWRTYAAVASLMLSPVLETLLWFPEPRYLLPMFPCLFFLGWLAVRHYRDGTRETLPPELRLRAALGYGFVLGGAAAYAAITGWPSLHKEMIWARTPPPSWREEVMRLPTTAVVMSDQPPAVSWWTRRLAIVAPVDERADLVTVLRAYQPSAYLDLGTHAPLTVWEPGELEETARGAGWTLYRIRRPDVASAMRPDTRTLR